jgi:ATP-dependent Lhr-like helicase
LPGKPKTEFVIKLLKNIEPKYLPLTMRKIFEGTSEIEPKLLFIWRLYHVLKRFGIISKDAEYGKIGLKKLAEIYRGSIVNDEVINELFIEKLDIKNAIKVSEMIKNGEIEIEVVEAKYPSKLASVIMDMPVSLSVPERPEKEILDKFKERIESSRLTLFCIRCCKWKQSFFVKNIPENLKCSNCKSNLIAVVYKNDDSIIKKKMRGEKLKKDEVKIYNQCLSRACMHQTYGKIVFKAFAAKGVGCQAAKRVLNRLIESEDDFYKYLLQEERKYFRTKQYWKK